MDYTKQNLPNAYELFLSTMGRCAGRFYVGSDFFYPDLLITREAAEDLLKEDSSSFKLSDSEFVFFSHQGYQFMYFPLSDSEPDPPVFNYIEGMEQPEKQWEHFSEFLLRSVEDHEKILLS